MNKAWITGLTVATVAGTGTAAWASMHVDDTDTAQAASQSALEQAPATAAAKSYRFQAGDAGTVDVTVAGGILHVDSAMPATGWNIVSFSVPGTHVEVALGNGVQTVTLSADLVDGQVQVSLDGTPLPETTTPTTPAPAPAAPATVLTPTSQAPSASHTTAPSGSGSGEHEDDDDHDDGEHESADHEDEHEVEGDD